MSSFPKSLCRVILHTFSHTNTFRQSTLDLYLRRIHSAEHSLRIIKMYGLLSYSPHITIATHLPCCWLRRKINYCQSLWWIFREIIRVGRGSSRLELLSRAIAPFIPSKWARGWLCSSTSLSRSSTDRWRWRRQRTSRQALSQSSLRFVSHYSSSSPTRFYFEAFDVFTRLPRR